jgi:hypothetical protein
MCIFHVKNLIPWNKTKAEPTFEISLGTRTPIISYFEPKDNKSDWRNAWEKKNWNGNYIVVHHDIDPYFMLANPDDIERTYIFKIGVSQELIAK